VVRFGFAAVVVLGFEAVVPFAFVAVALFGFAALGPVALVALVLSAFVAVERVLVDERRDFLPPTGSASPAAFTALPAALPAVAPTSPTARPTVFVTVLMILPGSGIGSPSRSRRRERTACPSDEQTPCRGHRPKRNATFGGLCVALRRDVARRFHQRASPCGVPAM
jgi:hypothetical protein